MQLPYIEPYKIKMIEPVNISTVEDRKNWIRGAGYNLFNIRSSQVTIDLLTDSGTGAMSDRQWSEMMLGDESYAGASSYFKLRDAITDITGFEHFLPTHQGRAAENVLFSALIKEGDIIPGNSHFDTTKGHIEFRKATAIDCTVDEAFDTTAIVPFKGNVNTGKLKVVIEKHGKEKIPFILITITNNTAGGQPVSIANMKEVREIADSYGIPVFFDSARFAENACFIRMREKGSIGSGSPIAIMQLAQQIATIVGKPHLEAEVTGQYRLGDIRHCFAAIDHARNVLSYEPAVAMEAGLVELAQWLKGQVAEDRIHLALDELKTRGLTV